jgi:uncharacterized protein YggU (UPF0235/DUF167 family)
LTSLWRKSRQEMMAYERANELVVDNKKLANTATVGRTNGAAIEILNAAFTIPVGQIRIIPGEDAFHIVKITEIITPKEDERKKRELTTEIRNTISRQTLDDYTGFLQNKYPIKVNDKTMRRLMSGN